MLLKPAAVLQKLKKERNQVENSFVIFFLDSDKKILSTHRRTFLEKPKIKISDIFIPAFYLEAQFLIIATVIPDRKKHLPNDFEIKQAQRIFSKGCFLNIQLLDYLIISTQGYYSFHEGGIM